MTRAAALQAKDDEGFVLRSPHPIGDTLPGVYRDAWLDEELRTGRAPFGPRFLAAFDDVLSPVIAVLDNLDSYFDVDTAPEDFLPWLGQWVAASVDASWPEERRRAFIGQAADLYRRRGTAAGLRDHLKVYTDGNVEVKETGDSSWSLEPDGPLPGKSEPVVVVLISVDDPTTVDVARLDAVIRASKPAHVVHRLQVITTGGDGRKGKATTTAGATGASSASGGDGAGDGSSTA